MMVLGTTGLVGCAGGGSDIEICDDGLDNDGDGAVDAADDECEAPAEICDNGADDDGDGAADCADADCVAEPACNPEDDDTECADGIDNDGDDLVDCDDDGCAASTPCSPSELWSFRGEGTVDSTAGTYTGTVLMIDEVVNNANGNYNPGDVLCEALYVHNSNGPTTSSVACTDCEWSFGFPEVNPLDTTAYGGNGFQGPACDIWYDFTAKDGGLNWFYGPSFVNFGFNADYATQNGSYSLMMFFYDANGYTGWYALPALATFDDTTGAHTWDLSLIHI